MPFRQSRQSSPSGSPLFSHRKWSDPSLQLPTSLPIRYSARPISRRGLILFGLAIISFFALVTRKNPKTTQIYSHLKDQIPAYIYPPKPPAFQGSCRLDLSTLESYNLTNEITYARRYIKQVPIKNGRDPRANLAYVEEMDQNIFTGLDHITVSSADQGNVIDLESCSPNALPVYMRNQSVPVNAEGLVFGVASTSERLLDFAPTMALWLADSGAQLITIVPTGPLVQRLRDTFTTLGINATVLTSNEQFLVNYFKLVEAFSAHGQQESKWFTFIDDDTHYFSLQRFVDALHLYDYNKEIYIGAVSEDLRQIRWDGIFAFGGAGVTVSRALLDRLHQNYYGCLAEQSLWEPGDVRLKRCIYQHTETKLTMIEGLHQVDLEGETSGIMEGPRPPINWHHYRSWSFQNVHLISLAGKICGASCLFQRWRFPVSVDFGYVFMTLHFGVSIIGYSVGIRPDLSKTEMTWRDMPGSNFDHSLAPLRMNLVEGRDRFTYRLRGVGKDVDGHVKHTYIKLADKELQKEKEADDKGEDKEKEKKSTINDVEKKDKRALVTTIDEVMELIFI